MTTARVQSVKLDPNLMNLMNTITRSVNESVLPRILPAVLTAMWKVSPAGWKHGSTLQTPLAVLVASIMLLAAPALTAATNDLTAALQQGLFEEEANRDLDAAIAAYQSLVTAFDQDRQIGATAIFRLGECYRKLGRTNEAVLQYERIINEFPDQTTLATLSRQNLTGLGASRTQTAAEPSSLASLSPSARAEQRRLLEEEIKLVEQKLATQQQLKDRGRISNSGLVETQRDLLQLKRQLVALSDQGGGLVNNSSIQLERLQFETDSLKALLKAVENSSPSALPTLLPAPNPVLNQLLQQINEVEQKLAGLRNDYGSNHPQVKSAEAQLELLRKRLDEQVDAIGKGLEAKLKALTASIEEARELTGSSARQGQVAQRGESTPVTDEEEQEIRRIQEMIRNSPDLINAPSFQGMAGRTPLGNAASKGQMRVASFLLDNGAQVDRMSDGPPPLGTAPPLYLAAATGHRAMVQLLLEHGANQNGQSKNGDTALHIAAQKGFEAVAETLLSNGSDVNVQDNRRGTPLHWAASTGQSAIIELLLENGADVNARDSAGWTPIFYAAGRGYPESTRGLLAANARTGIEDNNGRTALSYAASDGHLECVQALLEANADPNAGKRDLPLSVAIESSGSLQKTRVCEALLQHGADPNRMADVKLGGSLQVGDGNKSMNQGSTVKASPIQLAVARKLTEIVKLLLDYKADPNALGTRGWPLIYEAAFFEWKEIVEALLAAGADVNARGSADRTLLHMAAERGDRQMVELLLANKANVNARDNGGRTPLDAMEPGFSLPNEVARKRYDEVAALLREHGALADLPNMDRIEVRRPSANYSDVVFRKSTNDWNQFTLLELIAVQYQFLAGSPKGESRKREDVRLLAVNSQTVDALPFPDLANIRIRRPAPDGEGWQELKVDLAEILKSGNCSNDLQLGWGDEVIIPETVHPINERWGGFSRTELKTLQECLTREVTIIVEGQTNTGPLGPKFENLVAGGSPQVSPQVWARAPLWVLPVLWQSNLLLSSSDLSRVKVTRRDPATGEAQEWVLDCSDPNNAPDLWLRDGDVIEVPEKP